MTTVSTQQNAQSQLVRDIQNHATHFHPVFVPSPAPWLYSTLAQLWDLESGGAQIRGVGDFRVETTTAIRVRKLLSRISNKSDLPVPTVSVFSGGGLSLSWQVGPREVKYTFWPEGVVTFWKEQEGEPAVAEELADENGFDPREPIQWLLKR